ncbi:MAG: hypothetical protein KY463_04710 [Actinobacteria bacterium]|nr:hypothetical protein [Actinomycetota bacterium]
MELGKHLWELWNVRFGVVLCALVALFASLLLTHKVGLLPPRLEPRSLEMASASTEVLVDTPRSAVVDLKQDLFDIESMTNRAVLMGNVMASDPVVAYIGRRAGVPPGVIRVSTPRTPNSPRPLAGAGAEKQRTSDLLRSTKQYRLSIIGDPSVPILRIYSQAPTAQTAANLANAAVDGMRDYLAQQSRVQGVAPERKVRLQQLGRATGDVINGGVSLQVSVLAFLFVFGLAAAAAIFAARVRRGWQLAAEQEDGGGTATDDAHRRERDFALR